MNHLKTWRTLLGLVTVLSIANPLAAQPQKQVTVEEPFDPTRVIAKFKAKEKAGPQHPVLKQHGLKAARQYSLLPQVMVLELADEAQARAVKALPPQARAQGLRDRIAALQATGVFEYVEPDYIRTIKVEPTDTAFVDGTLWGLRNTGQQGGTNGADIGATAAWDITTGSSNVIVAVVDTGIRYTHQDLAANMWRNPGEIPGNGIDDDGDGYVDNVFGINALLNPKTNALAGSPVDDNGHGTHVAGTIGAAANDGNPHVGVSWSVRLMAGKFLDAAGNGQDSDAVECIDFAVAHGARIINASWGGSSFSQTLFDAISRAKDLGVLFVAAAGNDANNNDNSPRYPAGYALANIISVAALDRFDSVPHFSNTGQTNVHLGAPGLDIYSCWNINDAAYDTLSGTSMAAPHVSGVAALVLAAHPGATMEEVKQRILVGTVPIHSLQGFAATGGRVNAPNALTANNDGIMEIAISPPSGAILAAGSAVPVQVHVSDLFDLPNATVTGTAGGTSRVLANDGVSPDRIANDGYYTGWLQVPAGTTSLSLSVVVSCPGKASQTNTLAYPVLAPPQNDNFGDRVILAGSSNQVTGSNLAATREPGEPRRPNSGGRSVWWSWTAPVDGYATFSTAGSTFDTLLQIYSGASISNLTLLRSSDQLVWDGGTRHLVLKVLAGTTYQIAVDGFRNACGDIAFGLVFVSDPPVNDNFADRITLDGTNLVATGRNLLATAETGEPYVYGAGTIRSAWWTWMAPANGRVTISTDGSDFDTLLDVYTGDSVSALTHVAASDDANNTTLTSLVGFDVGANTNYQITVNGYSGAMGNIQLNLSFTAAPGNDNFADAATLGGTNVTVGGSNLGASKEPGEPNHAGSTGGNSVWWNWTAPSNGRVNLEVWGDAFARVAAVYVGDSVASLGTAVAQSGATTSTNRLGFDAAAGTTYHVAVDGANNSYGSFFLNLAFALAPDNNNFADRLLLSETNLTASGSTLGASEEPSEPRNLNGYQANNTVWWTWTAPTNGRAVVTAGGGSFYNLLGIYTGTALANLTLAASGGSYRYTNSAAVDVTAGTEYQIQVAAYSNGSGEFQLQLAFTPAAPNDNFADRFLLSETNLTASGSTLGASEEPSEPLNLNGYQANNTVWWTWTAPTNGRAVVTAGGGSFYNLLGIYTSTALANLTLAASGGSYRYTNSAAVDVTAGTEYQIQVAAYSSGSGEFQLQVAFTPAAPNDNFADRFLLSGTNVTFSGFNVGATREAGEPSQYYQGTHSVWWSWMAPTNGRVTVDLSSTNFGAVVHVWTGNVVSNLISVTSAARSSAGAITPGFDAQAGVSYQIAVDGYYSTSFGDFAGNLAFAPAPGNDNFADRFFLSGTNVAFSGFNVGATKEAGEPSQYYQGTHSVWWSWMAPTNGRVIVDLSSTNFGAVVHVWTGNVVSNLTSVTSAGRSSAGVATAVFNTQPGVVYQLAVDGYYSGSFGDYVLGLSFTPAPLNDNFTNRIVLSGTNLTTTSTSVAATKETGEPAHAGKTGTHSVWWTWIAPANGRLTVTTSGSDFDTLLAVYTGASVSTLTPKASNDDVTGSDMTSLVPLDVAAGTNYQIAVDGYNGAEGAILLGLSFSPAPPNDAFANRISLAGNSVTASGANLGATREAGEPNHGGYTSGHSVWWTWAAPADGTATIEATGDFSNVLGVYTNSSLGTLRAVAVGATSGTRQNVQFHAVVGEVYQIAVDGKSGASGNLALSLSLRPDIKVGIALVPTNGAVRLTLVGQTGAVYEVQATTNLVDWVLADTVTNQTGIVEWTDPAAASFSRRFYRAMETP